MSDELVNLATEIVNSETHALSLAPNANEIKLAKGYLELSKALSMSAAEEKRGVTLSPTIDGRPLDVTWTDAASSVSAAAAEEDVCYICKRPRNAPGELWCSYPHPLAGPLVPADTIEQAIDALNGWERWLREAEQRQVAMPLWCALLMEQARDLGREALAALATVREPARSAST